MYVWIPLDWLGFQSLYLWIKFSYMELNSEHASTESVLLKHARGQADAPRFNQGDAHLGNGAVGESCGPLGGRGGGFGPVGEKNF